MALLCGRYEGFDERVHEHLADDELSIGRYVLAGGELPAMVVADVADAQAAGRPRARATAPSRSPSASVLEGMPEYPHYTRPPTYRGWDGARGPASPATTRGCASWRLEQSRARAEQFDRGAGVGTIPQPRGARTGLRRFFLAAACRLP